MTLIVHCPACNGRIQISESRRGRKIRCPNKSCGHIFRTAVSETKADEDFDFSQLFKSDSNTKTSSEPLPHQSETTNSIKLLGLLVGGCVLITILAIGSLALFSNSDSQPKTVATIPVDDKATQEENNQQGQNNPLSKEMQKNADGGSRGESFSGNVQIFVILGFIFAIAYLGFILFSGSWIARDAYRRGMNGIAWCVFFYAFHVGWKLIAAGLSSVVLSSVFVTRSVVVTVIGLLILEVFSWAVGFTYWFSRRAGRPVPCSSCKIPTLAFLKTCPHCGQPPTEITTQ
ncbi:MAG: hypothetical protein U0798_13930 [Gemmataceae bacterium]